MSYETPESNEQTVEDYIGKLPKGVGRVLNGWLSLDDAERDEFQKATELFNNASDSDRRQLRQVVIMVITGPLKTKCPCCGRG
jgi:hypothetical protein